MNEEQTRQLIREELSTLLGINKLTFQKDIQIFNGKNIQLGKSTGTKIGTEITQKLAFFNATPVVQQAKINDCSGGTTQDTVARTTIAAIIDVLEAFGLTSST